MARPTGPLALALLEAARQRPGTVNELAARSQVAWGDARYTCSRLVRRGALVRVGQTRPAVLELPAVNQSNGDGDGSDLAKLLQVWV